MALRIQAKLNRPELQRFLNAIDEKTLRKVVSRSLNRTGVTVRKEAAQRIQKKIKLPSKEIKGALPIRNKPKASESIDSQEFRIAASAKGISLSKFKPQQVATGVSVNITGKRQVIKHAFLMKKRAESGRYPIMRRIKVRDPNIQPRRNKKGAELPIEKQAYKSVASILPEVTDQLAPIAEERFSTEFERNYKHLIGIGGS